MEDMKKYIPNLDEEKCRLVFELKKAYNEGRISLAEGQKRMREEVKTLSPVELAYIEQELKEIEDNECQKEDIQKMLELFEGVLENPVAKLDKNHPIQCYFRENEAIEAVLQEMASLHKKTFIKNQWMELYEKLYQFRTHLSRKQNQLYSILEQKGFDRPTTTMWLLDDFIRDEISEAFDLLKADKDEAFLAMQETVIADVRDLMQKENTVLYPTSLSMINEEEFESMKAGDHEIGFALISVDPPATSAKKAEAEPSGALAQDLAAVLSKYGLVNQASPVLEVANGKLTLEQINLIYRHMPVDLSYVDENELVCFYSDTAHRIFPRSKNVIGRDVKNCHPRTSVHIVSEIIEKFRSGEKDTVDFWINKPDLFIYIMYVAVRDEKGKFRGVLEMMQDCTHIRKLTGSQTLLSWSSSSEEDTPAPEKVQDSSAEVSETTEKGSVDPDHLDETTRLKDLLEKYPFLKAELPRINPKFKMLQTPLARVMIPKTTIKTMSERSGTDIPTLIEGIRKIIKEKA